MQVKKNPAKDAEKHKAPLLFIGLIFACSAVLVAFEWRTPYREDTVYATDLPFETIPVEIVPVSVIKAPPPPPPPPVQKQYFKIVAEPDPVNVAAAPPEPTEPTPPVIQYIPPPTEVIYEPKIVLNASVMPRFDGGEAALYGYLAETVQYPRRALDAGIEGTVYLTFVVDTAGNVTDVEVLRGIGGGCDEAAVRAIKNMPRWIPGKNNGAPVNVQFNLPVGFKSR